MMTTAEGGLAYQRWLATINQVCGHFAARPLEESFHGEIDARYAGSLKVSTVTAAGVNLYRTRNEIKRDNDAWFYTVFQLAGEAILEQDDRRDAGGRRYHVNRRRPPMLHRLAADLASGLAAAAAPAGGAHRGHHYRLPAGQISANGPAQPATAAGKHGRHDALRQRERSRAGGDRLPVAPGAASARSCPSRREKQFQKIIALIDASIQSEHLRPEWLASETGMSVRSLYRLFADQGLVVAQYIKNRRLDLCARRYRMFMTMKSWRGSATAGASATTAISPPHLSSALASPRGNTASAVANYLRSHWPFNPGRTPRAARGPPASARPFSPLHPPADCCHPPAAGSFRCARR